MSEEKNIQNSSINGSMSIGRNLTVGGKLNIKHNTTCEKDLHVKGWLNARNIRGAGKGLYETVAKLNAAYPSPENGWYALVGNTLPADIYRAWGKKWIATGEKGGEPSLEFEHVSELDKQLQDEVTNRMNADSTLQEGINTRIEVEKKISNSTGISEFSEFSEKQEYKTGEIVSRNGGLYEFIVDHAAGSWYEPHVKPTSLKKIQDEKLTELSLNTNRQVFTDNEFLNKFIKEIYFEDVDLEGLTEVRIVKLADQNAIQLVYSGNYKYNFRLNQQLENKIYKFSNVGGSAGSGTCYLLANWNLAKDGNNGYNCSISKNALNAEYSPAIKLFIEDYNSKITKLTEFSNKANTQVFTNNDFANSVIKELYFENVDISDITSIRLLNLSDYVWGIQLFSASSESPDPMYNFAIGGERTYSIHSANNAGGTAGTGKAYFLFDVSKLPIGTNKIITTTISEKTLSLDFNPSIKALILENNSLNNINRQVFTNNEFLNKFIKEIYFEDVDLDGLSIVRIVKSGAQRAIQLVYGSDYRYNFRKNVELENRIYEIANVGGSAGKGTCYVLANWDLVAEGNTAYYCSVSKNTLNPEFSPAIQAFIGGKTVTDYEIIKPDYVFGIESGSFDGREYFTNIYPEALLTKNIPIRINGNKKAILQRIKSSDSSYLNVYEETVNIQLGAENYITKNIQIKYIRSNRKNAINKIINLLPIGNSILEQNPSFPNGGGGSWGNFIKQFAMMDNEDIGNITLNLLGTRNKYTKTIHYNDKDIQCKNYGEGRSGWATYGYLNWSKWVRLDGKAYESSFEFIGAEAMYYALGLATKTPYDSETPGQEYLAYTANQDTYNKIVSTPIGRYKPNCNEQLWNALKNYKDFKQANPGDYIQATSDTIIISYLEDSMENPDNPFYSKEKAREYTGEHLWTYSNAFSIEKYLERYRTLDDNGVRLSGSAGESVQGSDGKQYTIGTKVSNIEDYDVCTPTHVISGLGTNDMTITSDKTALIQLELLNEIKKSCPNCQIGYFLPRRPGVLNPQDWQQYGLQKTISSFEYNKEQAISNEIGDLDLSRRINYIPAYFTASPISSGYNDRFAYDMDDIEQQDKVVSGSDGVHPSAYWHRSVGYQCLAWIYWSLQ